jgi:large subunit ribosomal protein L17
MFRNMAAALIVHGRIDTTEAKAKELRGIVERIITKAARSKGVGEKLETLSQEDRARQVHLRRVIGRFLPRFYNDGQSEFVDVMDKVFNVYGPRFKTRPGGYTRISKLGNRKGDNAPVARIEILNEE